jgi:hypothetical protein
MTAKKAAPRAKARGAPKAKARGGEKEEGPLRTKSLLASRGDGRQRGGANPEKRIADH